MRTLLLLPVVWLASCAPAARSEEKFPLADLEGRWEHVKDRAHQIEEWSQLGEEELRGRGFVLTDGDTVYIEFLSIRPEKGVLTYFAQVSDQNNGEIIPFGASAQNARTIEFYNAQHDFPKKIIYQFHSRDSLSVFVEGPRNGKTARITYEFVRAGTN